MSRAEKYQELLALPACELAERLASGSARAVEVTEAYLQRILSDIDEADAAATSQR